MKNFKKRFLQPYLRLHSVLVSRLHKPAQLNIRLIVARHSSLSPSATPRLKPKLLSLILTPLNLCMWVWSLLFQQYMKGFKNFGYGIQAGISADYKMFILSASYQRAFSKIFDKTKAYEQNILISLGYRF